VKRFQELEIIGIHEIEALETTPNPLTIARASSKSAIESSDSMDGITELASLIVPIK